MDRSTRAGQRTRIALITATIAGFATAQRDWQPIAKPWFTTLGTGVYLPKYGRSVFFGGGESHGPRVNMLTEWDGKTPTARVPVFGPYPRYGAAFERSVGGAVLFGGVDETDRPLSDTWTWNGQVWIPRATNRRPSARSAMGTCFDSTRGRTLIFGGDDGALTSNELWEWNGQDWRLLRSGGPSPRRHAITAYDEARSKLLVFGGWSTDWTLLHDGWEFNGRTWTPLAGARIPPKNVVGACFDSKRRRPVIVTSGGIWTFDGLRWSRIHRPTTSHPLRGPVVYDPDRDIVTFGVQTGNFGQESFATWDGHRLHVPPHRGPRSKTNTDHGSCKATYDIQRRRLVVKTHLGLLMSHGADGWSQDLSPLVHRHLALAYDMHRGVTILVGGQRQWCQALASTTSVPIPSPAGLPRQFPAIAYDVHRRRTVLFGGGGPTGAQNDTWELVGTRWIQRQPLHQPPPVPDPILCYDSHRRLTVMFDNSRSTTWEWDGTDWQRSASRVQPFGLAGMAYHPINREITALGIPPYKLRGNELWTYDGTLWRKEAGLGNLGARTRAGMAYDVHRGQVVVFGGSMDYRHQGRIFGWPLTDLWGLRRAPASTVHRYGVACPTDAHAMALGEPILGSSRFALSFRGVSSRLPAAAVFGLAPGRTALGHCSLWIDQLLGVVGGLGAANGTLRVALPIPNNPWLVGRTLYAQTVQVQGTSIATATEGISLRIGY